MFSGNIVNILNEKYDMKKSFCMLFFALFAAVCCGAGKSSFSLLESPEEMRAGSTSVAVARFIVPKGSHLYASDAKDAIPTQISAKLPDGFSLEKIQFPRPSKFEFMGMHSEGYSADFSVRIFIKAPPYPESEPQKITLTASWLECSSECVPASATAEFQTRVVAPPQGNGAASETDAPAGGFWAALLGAFLGGIILNAMPCVFPVIGLKIMSFASSAARSSTFKNGAFFSAGIILTFALLGCALAAIKAFGGEVGWGLQLQNPHFAAAMCALFWLLALNFAGFWEFGSWVGAKAQTADMRRGSNAENWGAFASGILAVLVASPCVAPFMASAVGFALAGEASPVECAAVITAVGVGMSAPYILLSARPSLLKKLPKSGAWLGALKKALSIPLFLTSFWLLWLYLRENGSIARIAAALAMLSVAAYVWGRFANVFAERRHRIFAAIFCAAALAASVAATATDPLSPARKTPAQGTAANSNAWSPQKTLELRKQGKIVFVNFTASWCLTCQVNKAVLASAAAKKLFAENNATMLVADWTNRDAAVLAELKKYRRAGVPLYLVFPADIDKEPLVLPSILTVSEIAEAFDKSKQ